RVISGRIQQAPVARLAQIKLRQLRNFARYFSGLVTSIATDSVALITTWSPSFSSSNFLTSSGTVTVLVSPLGPIRVNSRLSQSIFSPLALTCIVAVL